MAEAGPEVSSEARRAAGGRSPDPRTNVVRRPATHRVPDADDEHTHDELDVVDVRRPLALVGSTRIVARRLGRRRAILRPCAGVATRPVLLRVNFFGRVGP
jgi:hypothetical protein